MKLSQLPVGALVKDTKSVYLGSVPIFRVLEHGHTGDPAGSTTLDFRDVICLKCFDAKEPSNTDTNRQRYGNNRYLYSNILQWLNSDASAGNWYTAQHSVDAPPNSSNVWTSDGTTAINPYDTEAGFLSFMSAQFRAALMTVSKTTVKNTVTDGGGSETVSSKIFLLSTTEVGLGNENSIAEGSVYSYYSSGGNDGRKKNIMNEAAKGNYSSATSPLYWWLRTPYASTSHYVQRVYTDGTLRNYNAYNSNFGVSPAFCVSSNLVVSDTTDTDGAYTIEWPIIFDRLYVGDENNKSRLYKPEIITMSDGAGDIRFGIDGNGKYGYYKDGEDTVTAFVGEDVLLKDGSVAADNLTIGRRSGGSTVGANSFAQGNGNTASGAYSHAEGYSTTARGQLSHAEGMLTTAGYACNHAQGHYNKDMSSGSTTGTSGNAMAIGNGADSALSNAFRVTFAGQVYGLSAFNSSGADYAEFFEWEDGNEKNEDRVGYFVTLSGDKIKKATAGDYILGIISGQPSVIGNGDEDWLGRWQRDDFGRFIWGEIEEEDPITKEKTKVRTILANSAYDPEQEYIERKDRKEWDCVGMLGALAVRDDGTCEVNGFCGVKDGIATKAESGYRVIERVSDNVIRVIFR